MANTQHIVVYTPVQDALYNGGLLIPLIGGLGSGFLMFVILTSLHERFVRSHVQKNDWAIIGSAILSFIAGSIVFRWLII